jgi:hypothetical protein
LHGKVALISGATSRVNVVHPTGGKTLVFDEARYVTGVSLRADAGFLLR